jgi:hypothetical protein
MTNALHNITLGYMLHSKQERDPHAGANERRIGEKCTELLLRDWMFSFAAQHISSPPQLSVLLPLLGITQVQELDDAYCIAGMAGLNDTVSLFEAVTYGVAFQP